MNLGMVQVDGLSLSEPSDITPQLRAEEARLVTIIEALQEVQRSKGWSTLKTELFETLVNVLERDLRTEARQDTPNPVKLSRINGELKWAERYADLQKFEEAHRVQLQNVRKKLHGKTE